MSLAEVTRRDSVRDAPHDTLIQLPFAAMVVEKAARLVAKIRHLVDNPGRTDLVVTSPQMPRPDSEYEAWPVPADDECD